MNLESKGQWDIGGFHEDQTKGGILHLLVILQKSYYLLSAYLCVWRCANHIKYIPLWGSSDYLHFAYV